MANDDMENDDLAVRRAEKIRERTLRLTTISARLQWSPHWEIELRATGRWWFVLMSTVAALCVGVVATRTLVILAQWIADGDVRLLALSVAFAAIVVGRAIALARRRVQDEDPQ